MPIQTLCRWATCCTLVPKVIDHVRRTYTQLLTGVTDPSPKADSLGLNSSMPQGWWDEEEDEGWEAFCQPMTY